MQSRIAGGDSVRLRRRRASCPRELIKAVSGRGWRLASGAWSPGHYPRLADSHGHSDFHPWSRQDQEGRSGAQLAGAAAAAPSAGPGLRRAASPHRPQR